MEYEKILFKDECYQIQGAVFDVYLEMGCGFLEAVYQECLEKEFYRRGIPFASQKKLKVIYKDEELRLKHRPDFICSQLRELSKSKNNPVGTMIPYQPFVPFVAIKKRARRYESD